MTRRHCTLIVNDASTQRFHGATPVIDRADQSDIEKNIQRYLTTVSMFSQTTPPQAMPPDPNLHDCVYVEAAAMTTVAEATARLSQINTLSELARSGTVRDNLQLNAILYGYRSIAARARAMMFGG